MGLAAFNRMRRQKAAQEQKEQPAEVEPKNQPAKAKKPAKAKE